MNINEQHVHCLNRDSVPPDNETITDDFDIHNLVNDHSIFGIMIYKRNRVDCPFGRGNWVIDVHSKNRKIILCIKLSLIMEEEAVMKWIQPLITLIRDKKKSKMH